MKNTISVPVDTLSLGQHTVKVEVSDGQGGKASRTWTFRRTNSTPTISGTDTNLGDKNLGFTYEYTVDDADGDELTVTEQLNGDTLRTINNAPKKETLSLTIDAEKLYSLGLNTVNNLVITVTDGKGGTATAASPSSVPTARRPSRDRTRMSDCRQEAFRRSTPSTTSRAIMWSLPSSWTTSR